MKIKKTVFTVEEINLMHLFDTTSRAELLADLRECLPDVDEPEIAEIVNTTIGKLEHMTDEEFQNIGLYPADEFDDWE